MTDPSSHAQCPHAQAQIRAGLPVWALLSSLGAPLFLIGGWTWAAAQQHAAFDPVHQTISALAATYADSRWIMTAALYAVGTCHMITACGLRVARSRGRALLALGGASTVLVAAAPLSEHGSPALHMSVASVALGSLALWPLAAMRRDLHAPPLLRPASSLAAAFTLSALLAWLIVEMSMNATIGLAERAAAAAQACWPLSVVLSCRLR